MSVRRWQSAFVTAMVLVGVVMSGCTSPGKPFSYLDVKISLGPSASPVQPVVGQATSINFTIRNTWNQPLTAVAWEIRENTDPLVPTSGAVIATGVTDIVAFGSSAQTFALGGLAKGTHTYAVTVDPANVIAEQNETNNTTQLSVLVADQDLSFGSPAPLITWPSSPNITDQPTLTFTILDTVNIAQTTPIAVSVPYTITVNGVALAPIAIVATPASPVSINPTGITPPVTVTQLVTVTLPALGSVGSFVYIITLSPAAGDDSVTTNNIATVVVSIPAPG
jgi:CARDB